MILNVKVDVSEVLNELFEDFNPEYDTFNLDLKHDIKKDVAHQVKREVLKFYGEDLKKQMTLRVKHLIDKSYEELIGKKCEEFVANGTLQPQYKGGEEISVEDWIKSEFKQKGNYNRLPDLVKDKADKLIKEISNRYDLLFASQLITKLNENDMLKEGVFKSLMETNN